MNRRGFMAGVAAAVLGATASIYGLALPAPRVETERQEIIRLMTEAIQRIPEHGRRCFYMSRDAYAEFKGLAERYRSP
jgi:hypothetical protein